MVTGQLWRLGPNIRSEIFRAEKPRSALQVYEKTTKTKMELKNQAKY